MFYIKNSIGSWQVGNDREKGRVSFKIFFPDSFDPEISEIRVSGDFQSKISAYPDWDFENSFKLIKSETAYGTFWHYVSDKELTAGYYQYKYFITFNDGSTRIVTDPCARYGGSNNHNSAFVIGGSRPEDNIIKPLKNNRKHYRDLTVYEMMIDDFTFSYKRNKAPLAAVIEKLDYIKNLGFNAILFMPWSAWYKEGFDWGYEPFQYFAVEYRYANAHGMPEEKLSWLKKLVSECHERDIHAIMDGVFNHASRDFPYKFLYLDPGKCPFTGSYGGYFPGLQDLDFNNECTNNFIRDVCFYWIDNFKIDGIRFDNTVNFYVPGNPNGLLRLIGSINNHLNTIGEKNFSLILEHIDKTAINVTKTVNATSYWDNSLYECTFDYLWNNSIDTRFINSISNRRYFNKPEHVPTLYLSNHDHSHIAGRAGEKKNIGRYNWYKLQPYIIALFTSPGVPMIYNGAEFAEDYTFPEDDHGTGLRVNPRPLRWERLDDDIGKKLSVLYKRLACIRNDYEGLRSENIYPCPWEEWQEQFNPGGYGINLSKQAVIYHRWGYDNNEKLQQFMIVLNFSDFTQHLSVPFPENGKWTDLLSGYKGTWKPLINNNRLEFEVGSNWGHVFYR